MEVSFEIDRDDFWQFNRYVYLHLPKFRSSLIASSVFWFAFPFLVVVATLSALGGNPFSPANAAFLTITTITLGCFGLISRYWGIKRQVMAAPAERPGLLGAHTVTIDVEGLKNRTSASYESFSWSSITSIADTNEHIFIVMNDIGGWPVPKRAFPTVAEAHQFRSMALSYWTAASRPECE